MKTFLGILNLYTIGSTTVGAIIGFVLKSFWDRFWKRKDELETLKRNKQIELLERQLSEFYWPVYFRLQKDNAVWKRILDRDNKDDLIKQNVGKEIEKNFILPNHDETVRLIEQKIHLAKADEEFLEQLLVYVRHVAVYSAMRSSGIYDYDPIYLGEPWPAKLVGLIEQRTNRLQQTYDRLIALGSSH